MKILSPIGGGMLAGIITSMSTSHNAFISIGGGVGASLAVALMIIGLTAHNT